MTVPKNPPLTILRVPRPTNLRLTLKLVGTQPLIISRMTNEAIAGLRAGMLGGAKPPRTAREPENEFVRGMHFIGPRPDDHAAWAARTSWKYGIPSCAIKESIVVTGQRFFRHPRPLLYGSFWIPGPLLSLVTDTSPKMREDIVHVRRSDGSHTIDLRWRAEFFPWSVTVPIIIHYQGLSPLTLVTILKQAGVSTGVGQWRVECGGDHGMFEVLADKLPKEPTGETEPNPESVASTPKRRRASSRK